MKQIGQRRAAQFGAVPLSGPALQSLQQTRLQFGVNRQMTQSARRTSVIGASDSAVTVEVIWSTVG